MITEAALAAAGVWDLRAMAHRAIVLGLRAPRLRHDQKPVDPAVAPEAISEVCISGPRARRLFGWLVMPALPTLQPAPAVLVLHGWGANAATMWPLVAPLHAAGFAAYRQRHVADPARRQAGFLLTVVPTSVLFVLGLIGALGGR